MGDGSEEIIRFIEGETPDPSGVLIARAAEPEGRELVMLLAGLTDRAEAAPHPPDEMLMVWPETKLPGVDEHLRVCQWCRLQWLQNRSTARFVSADPAAAWEARSSRPSLPVRLARRAAGWMEGRPRWTWLVPAAAAVVAAVLVSVLRSPDFPYPVASPDQRQAVLECNPLTQGLGFGGQRQPIPAFGPFRAGYLAALSRDLQALDGTTARGTIEQRLAGDPGVSSEATSLIVSGRNPCGYFSADRQQLCTAGIISYRLLRDRMDPEPAAQRLIRTAVTHAGGPLPAGLQRALEGGQGTIDGTFIRELVALGL